MMIKEWIVSKILDKFLGGDVRFRRLNDDITYNRGEIKKLNQCINQKNDKIKKELIKINTLANYQSYLIFILVMAVLLLIAYIGP